MNELRVQLLNLVREQSDLVQVEACDIANRVRKVDRAVVNHPDNGLQVRRSLRHHQAELGQMIAQCIDQWIALVDKGLMCPESYCTGLMLGALHRHIMQIRSNSRFRDRHGVRCIVLLPFDERLYVDRRDQADTCPSACANRPQK